MVWVWTFAVMMVVLVGAAVLPRRVQQPREGFPWFWLSFPAAVLLVAGSLHMWLPHIGTHGGWLRYLPMTNRPAVLRIISNEQYWLIQAFLVGAWILPVLALVAVGLSVWAWRRGRV
ncbi:hypothetical protein [Dietzia maris]|uniref:hypothetical protein n=1 Tax=Dietzia maris TaxID=37915 RepID=UPI0037CC8EDA